MPCYNEDMPVTKSLDAARIGTSTHQSYFRDMREQGYQMGGGWELLSIDRSMGGRNRPDVVYVNHETKRVLVEDLYTGRKTDVSTASGYESNSHYQKGWSYSNEPEIGKLISQGYDYDYAGAMYDPRKALHELN